MGPCQKLFANENKLHLLVPLIHRHFTPSKSSGRLKDLLDLGFVWFLCPTPESSAKKPAIGRPELKMQINKTEETDKSPGPLRTVLACLPMLYLKPSPGQSPRLKSCPGTWDGSLEQSPGSWLDERSSRSLKMRGCP